MDSGQVMGMPGLILFLAPWVAFGIFTGIFPPPNGGWVAIPYWIAGGAWVVLGVLWDLTLVVTALS